MEDPFCIIPNMESLSGGEEVVIFTILSEIKEECPARFGGLLDAGGYNIDEPCEPETPYRGDGESPECALLKRFTKVIGLGIHY